ncbi:MAG: GNAT family N-acetyltransferase [Burkholderiales bacterium]
MGRVWPRHGHRGRPLNWVVRLHMEIREAAVSEAESLSALALESKAHWGYSSKTIESWKDQLRISPADVASKPTFVGDISGDIAGFYSLAPSEHAWELDNVWVAPQYMHRGIGRALLNHALKVAFRAGASSVVVDADPNAEAFYLSCGATRSGEVPAPIPGEPRRVRPQLAFNERRAT